MMSLGAAIDNFVISGTRLWLSAQQHHPPAVKTLFTTCSQANEHFLKGNLMEEEFNDLVSDCR